MLQLPVDAAGQRICVSFITWQTAGRYCVCSLFINIINSHAIFQSTEKREPTTGQVLAIYKQTSQASHVELQKNLAGTFPEFDTCEALQLYVKVKRAYEKAKQFRGQLKEKFLETPFYPPMQKTDFPSPQTSNDTETSLSAQLQSVTLKSQELENQHKALKRQHSETEENLERLVSEKDQAESKVNILESLLEMTNTKISETLSNTEIKATEIQYEINEWETKFSLLTKQFDEATEYKEVKLQLLEQY
ncbi:hypothetical protein DPMN_109785 [Dreissena polymorpha]|uniref:Uncharacterized protein n=1 Tax=Dreissena polymorpha TaxID=45954 RepID=A0A9D4QNC9_DREPO|nr:hypothetical protein DPMN_109785 [Dreissena polymorpha]